MVMKELTKENLSTVNQWFPSVSEFIGPYENMVTAKNLPEKIFLHTSTKFLYGHMPSPHMESTLITLS